MAYERVGHYAAAPPRGYHEQQAPRPAPRGGPRPGPRGPPPQHYDEGYVEYGHGRGQQQYQGHGQEQDYQGYGSESFWGAYGAGGGGSYGYDQYYEQEYGHGQQHQFDQGYYNPPPPRRGPPPQSRGQIQQRGDGYGPPRGRGNSNGIGSGPGSGRGPPQGYPPHSYGLPSGGLQRYDDRGLMGGGQGGPSPPRQRQRLEPVQSPVRSNLDNPFPVFGNTKAPTAKSDVEIAEQAMMGLDINGHPMDKYGPRPPFEGGRGPPGREMTMPQDNEYPVDNTRFNAQQQHPWPEQQYDVGYGPGRRDPMEQHANTIMGERPTGASMQPPRPSTATGMRPQPAMQQRNDFPEPRSAGPTFSPPFAGPPRPGTSQGSYSGPVPAPVSSRPGQNPNVENWMLAESPAGGFAQQVHRSRSQPDVRGQQPKGAAYGAPPDAPMVPRVPPQMQGQNPGPRRDGPQPLATNNVHSFNTGMPGAGSMPNSPRQFHRPGAPPLSRNETAQSGRSDPGPGGPSTNGGQRLNGTSISSGPNAANPDALPVHPAPVRPGLAGGVQPGPAQIRKAQTDRHSVDAVPQGKRRSTPITPQELERLRTAVQVNPSDHAQALHYAKKLVEASRILANEGGRADKHTAQKNRERYIFEAHEQVKRLISANYAEAMFFLADCYGTGQLGLAADPKEAFSLYQAAAKLNHGASAYRTAVCCEMGMEAGGGTRKDPVKAVQWYKRAAALGDTPAMYKLGMILLKGLLGQQPSMGEAIIWLQRAADKADEENPHALHELAQIYENAPPNGKVVQDQGYALQMYQKAAKFGYRNSQTRLGKAYEYGHLGCQIDNRSSIHWYSKAAAQEDHDAELALSGWYLTGSQGILAASDQEAYLWARKAALAELPKAEFAMGYFSETGIGCPKSLEDAKRWYGRAASHRYPKAQQRLEELIRGGGKNLKNRERLSRGDEKKHEDCVLM